MTQERLSPEEYSFSRVFETSKENLSHQTNPVNINLETYFQALFQIEPIPTIFEKAEPSSIPEDLRHHALDDVLGKLSTIEIGGKEHIEEYLRYQYRCYFQANTIMNSYKSLELFLRFMKQIGKARTEEVERRDLEAFVEHEQDRGMKLSTVRMRLAIVKAFLRFIVERGVVGEGVFPWKLRIKMPEALPRAMDPDDVDKLLAVKGSVGDRAMILLLLRTGMRIGELLSTRLVDVNMEEQKILIFEGEKNLRGRVVYFSDDAKAALKTWLKRHEQKVKLLFYGYRGKRLSYAAARMMFMKYLAKAGLTQKGYTLHCLRHTYATELLNVRMPLECLEKLMGHSRLEVTRRYAMLTDKTKEAEYFKAMAIIERREKDGNYGCDRELQAIFEKTQLLDPHSEQLHEHP